MHVMLEQINTVVFIHYTFAHLFLILKKLTKKRYYPPNNTICCGWAMALCGSGLTNEQFEKLLKLVYCDASKVTNLCALTLICSFKKCSAYKMV